MVDLYGRDLFGNPIEPPSRGVLSDRFVFPPFSVLDARGGDWQARKRAWISLGINSHLGRPERLIYSCKGTAISNKISSFRGGTSIFDPVLCELSYRWFCPAEGNILDPFSGGSVRGIVAAALGRSYVGVDIRREQVEANESQWEKVSKDFTNAPSPRWLVGDSADMGTLVPRDESVDFVFSCPPYADLERYSDDPLDLSTMKWPEFLAAYRRIVAESVARMKPNRFACFVVGDIRCPRGNYRNFPGETIRAFEDAGARLYNESVLMTQSGTLGLTAPKIFSASRKLGKAHQNVLVFVKGDGKRAASACEKY